MTDTSDVRVSPEQLHGLTVEVLRRLEIPDGDAALVADCLVQVDLRGVFSHGTRRLPSYVELYEQGALNPNPRIETTVDEGAAIVLNGDGGLGYLVAHPAVQRLLDKTESSGIAVAATRFHGHVGSLGIYARMALERGFVTISVAGGRAWQPPEDPGATVWDAMRSPPLCIAAPTAEGPPLVVDMSVNFFRDRDGLEEAMLSYREAVIKSLGLKFAATIIGGMLGGQYEDSPASATYPAASRGFLMIAMKPGLIADSQVFQAQVSEVLAASRELRPLTGLDSAEVPGSLEWQREQLWKDEGIPLESTQRLALEELAGRMDIAVPWS